MTEAQHRRLTELLARGHITEGADFEFLLDMVAEMNHEMAMLTSVLATWKVAGDAYEEAAQTAIDEVLRQEKRISQLTAKMRAAGVSVPPPDDPSSRLA
jgi:transcription elongation GreA/GreB family factor